MVLCEPYRLHFWTSVFVAIFHVIVAYRKEGLIILWLLGGLDSKARVCGIRWSLWSTLLPVKFSIHVTPDIGFIHFVRILTMSCRGIPSTTAAAATFQVRKAIANSGVEIGSMCTDGWDRLVETGNLELPAGLLPQVMGQSEKDCASQQVCKNVFPIKVLPLQVSSESEMDQPKSR